MHQFSNRCYACVCRLYLARLSTSGVRGNTFECISDWSDLIWPTAMEIYVCSALLRSSLLHLKQFRQHNFQSATENETEKNGKRREQKTENWRRKKNWKRETVQDKFSVVVRHTTVGVESSRVGREMNDDLYMYFIWVAFSCLRKRRRKRERERVTKLSPWGQGEGGCFGGRKGEGAALRLSL